MHSGRDLYLSRHTYSVLSYVTSGSRFLSLVANPGKDVFNMKQKSNFMTAKEWLNQAHFMTWGIPPQPARAKPYVLSDPGGFSHPRPRDAAAAPPSCRSGQRQDAGTHTPDGTNIASQADQHRQSSAFSSTHVNPNLTQT